MTFTGREDKQRKWERERERELSSKWRDKGTESEYERTEESCFFTKGDEP